jgi:hypothetical protein
MLTFNYDGFMADIAYARNAEEVAEIFTSLKLLNPADYKAAINDIEKHFVENWLEGAEDAGSKTIEQVRKALALGLVTGTDKDLSEGQMTLQFVQSLYEAKGADAHPVVRFHAEEILKLSEADKSSVRGLPLVTVNVFDRVQAGTPKQKPSLPKPPGL